MPRHDPLLKRSDHSLHGLKLRREHDKARARIDQASAYCSTMFSSTTAQPPIAVADAAPPLRVKACQQETHAPQQNCAYSITSSARASRDAGMVRPSVLAVLRLTASSNLVGCCTG